jgi:very-short-patch-repair endonuclease
MIDHESERTKELHSRGIEVIRIPNELLIRTPNLSANSSK